MINPGVFFFPFARDRFSRSRVRNRELDFELSDPSFLDRHAHFIDPGDHPLINSGHFAVLPDLPSVFYQPFIDLFSDQRVQLGTEKARVFDTSNL